MDLVCHSSNTVETKEESRHTSPAMMGSWWRTCSFPWSLSLGIKRLGNKLSLTTRTQQNTIGRVLEQEDTFDIRNIISKMGHNMLLVPAGEERLP